jgi:hypothetical protein
LTPSACRQVKAKAIRSTYDVDAQCGELWDSLRSRVGQIVAESNCLACERLWTVAAEPDESVLRVCAATDALDCVEISLDPATATLSCDFGSSTGWGKTVFQIIRSGKRTALRLGDAELTVDETLDVILNRLKFPDA